MKNVQAGRDATSDYDKEKLQERVAKLAGGVAIKVGADRGRMKERRRASRMRCTRPARRSRKASSPAAAWYLRARANVKGLQGSNPTRSRHQDRDARAEEPLRQIVANAGDEPSVVLNKVVEARPTSASTPRPATTAISSRWAYSIRPRWRAALQGAASIASLLLTTDAMVAGCEGRKGGGAGMGGAWVAWAA